MIKIQKNPTTAKLALKSLDTRLIKFKKNFKIKKNCQTFET